MVGRQVRVCVGGDDGRRVPQDPLQSEDVAAGHDEVTCEGVAEIVHPNPRVTDAKERTFQFLRQGIEESLAVTAAVAGAEGERLIFGWWVITYHLFETCMDLEDSLHGHASFYIDVP